MGWLHLKLMLVGLLIIYHLYCYKFTRAFALDRNVRTSKWYRLFNELPSLLLIGIVILAVVKPYSPGRVTPPWLSQPGCRGSPTSPDRGASPR